MAMHAPPAALVSSASLLLQHAESSALEPSPYPALAARAARVVLVEAHRPPVLRLLSCSLPRPLGRLGPLVLALLLVLQERELRGPAKLLCSADRASPEACRSPPAPPLQRLLVPPGLLRPVLLLLPELQPHTAPREKVEASQS